MMTRVSARTLAMTAALFAAPLSASADLLVDGGPASSLQTFSTGDYVAGSEFTITSPMTVRSLGWIDADQLAHDRTVGCVDPGAPGQRHRHAR